MGFLGASNDSKIVAEVQNIPIAVLDIEDNEDLAEASSDDERDVEIPVLVEVGQRKNPRSNRRRLSLLQALGDGYACKNCKTGRRRSRRDENGRFLQRLAEPGEDEFEDIKNHQPTVFERLFNDKEAMGVWEEFINQPEEEQNAILNRHLALQDIKERRGKERVKPIRRNKYFKRIRPLLREFLLSNNLPKGALLTLEPHVIQFFLDTPQGQYLSDPLANNERKVLHGLAEYLDLESQSFNPKTRCDSRCTRVTNPKSTFSRPDVLLSEFLGIS